MKNILCLVFVLLLGIGHSHAQMGGVHFSTPAPVIHTNPAPASHPHHVHTDAPGKAGTKNPQVQPTTTSSGTDPIAPKKKKKKKADSEGKDNSGN